MWEGDQLFAGPALHRLPAVHDVDFIRPFAEHLQVMADQQDGGVVVLVEPRQQANNLRLVVGSMALVGSSAISRRGWLARAMAIITFWHSPSVS